MAARCPPSAQTIAKGGWTCEIEGRPSVSDVMQLSPARSSDASLLATLNHQLILDEGHRNRMSVAELEDRMREWLGEDYAAYIFYVDSNVVGYVLYRFDNDYVYVRQFFIVSTFRQHGLGRFAFEWMSNNVWNNARVRIDVLTQNVAGIAFWRALGFTEYCITMEREPTIVDLRDP